MSKKVLVTGAAGFIGFHTVQKLINTTDYEIIGLDNINDYYNPILKKDRLKKLLLYPKFSFKKDLFWDVG